MSTADRLNEALSEAGKSRHALHKELKAEGVRGSAYASVRSYCEGDLEPPLEFVLAAAKALDLDFIPIAQEQYDIILARQYRNDVLIENVLETMRSPHYRDRVSMLGGYDPSRSGEFWMDKG